MNFLAPIWLVLTAAVAVPLFLHLLRRRIEIRREFPAARYLARAEKENVRRLKLRNMLLMLLRTLALFFLALAAARPIGALLGTGHVPTALVVVVDNSMSTGAIVDGSPLLARLKTVARSVVAGTESNDQAWLVTADGTVTGGARNVVLDAIERIEPLGGRADLTTAITHAAGIALAAKLSASTVVVLTDGQSSQWPGDLSLGAVRVVAYAPPGAAPYNRAVTMAEARLSDGQSLRAVNELFIGPRGHGSALYDIAIGGRREQQSSSGVIVATGLGSTAWLKSLVTGSMRLARAADPALPQHDYQPLAWDTGHLVYAVREPFPSRSSQAELVFGEVSPEAPLSLRSRMPDQGVIFSDGMEADFLRFGAGVEAQIGLAATQGRLVV